jgi:hypothetical protein
MTQDLYYPISSSNAISSSSVPLTLIRPNDPNYYVWDNIDRLEISASAYSVPDSGSTSFGITIGDLKIYAYSGSVIVATFPADSTNIYYTYPPYESSTFTTTSSYANLNLFFDIVDVSSPELNGTACSVFQLPSTSSYFSLVAESGSGAFSIMSNTTYSLFVSGSGSYDAYLYLNNRTLGSSSYALSSSNTALSASFVPSAFTNYEVTFSIVGPPL